MGLRGFGGFSGVYKIRVSVGQGSRSRIRALNDNVNDSTDRGRHLSSYLLFKGRMQSLGLHGLVINISRILLITLDWI